MPDERVVQDRKFITSCCTETAADVVEKTMGYQGEDRQAVDIRTT